MFALAACGGDKETEQTVDELTPRLEAAKTALDDAETIELTLATKALPSGVTGLLSASGQGNHDPAFTGDVKVVTGGTSLGAEVISVDDTVYAKTGFSPTFLEIDPASLGAPDPAALFATSGGVSDLLVNTDSLKAGEQTRDGEDVLTTISGTLAGSTVQSLIPTADAAKKFAVTYSLNDSDELQKASIKGPFYPGGEATTYTLTPAISDEPLTVTAP